MKLVGTIIATCTVNLLISLDVTMVNVALTSIQRELRVPVGQLSWVVQVYSIAFAVLLLAGGAVSDRLGSAPAFLVGSVVFGVGSVMGATAPSLALLLLSRLVQGVGAAICVPSALAVLRERMPSEQLARAIAMWVFSASIAISLGPLLGGLLVEFVSWRGIFVINVPLVIGALVLLRPYSRIKSLDHQLAGVSPIRALAMWSVFRYSAAIGGIISAVNFGMLYALGIYYGRENSAVVVGALFLPMMISCGVSTMLVGRIRARIADSAVVTLGLAAQLLGSVLIAISWRSDGAVSASAVLLGFGVGLAIPTITANLLSAADGAVVGLTSGAFTALRQLGGVLGVAITAAMVDGAHGRVDLGATGMTCATALAIGIFVHFRAQSRERRG
ncbi:MFS transporter [Nocardia camponoti]|uniref:MFS transporter n=1 Tax=Nocardia camponoti TaxID=1616106 RepID=A0A917QM23_9NOCA|nr:MFS transporter [Nocardia camponoti]